MTVSLSDATRRGCVIVVEQLPNGYWYCKVSVLRVPQLPQPHDQEAASFHNAPEAVQWAMGVIDLLTRGLNEEDQSR